MDSGCIDPHFLDLGTSWRWVVNFTHRPLFRREKAPGTHWIGGWVDLRAGLDDLDPTWPYRDSNSDPSVVQPVASRYTDYAIPAPIHKTLLHKCPDISSVNSLSFSEEMDTESCFPIPEAYNSCVQAVSDVTKWQSEFLSRQQNIYIYKKLFTGIK
jgi:hypothetical protein